MIETRRGEGSFVRVNRLADYFRPAFLFSVDNHEMEEIYAFRSMFESATAEAAARKATPAQIRRLERNYTRMCQETDHYEQYVHTDLEFHMMICECTQNTLALQIYNSYENLLAPSILHTTQTIGVGNGVKYHGLILEALKNRDPQQAQARDAGAYGKQSGAVQTVGRGLGSTRISCEQRQIAAAAKSMINRGDAERSGRFRRIKRCV